MLFQAIGNPKSKCQRNPMPEAVSPNVEALVAKLVDGLSTWLVEGTRDMVDRLNRGGYMPE